ITRRCSMTLRIPVAGVRVLALFTREKTMAARTPEELDSLFREAMGRGDVDAVIALYEPNAVFPCMQGEVGSDQVRSETR
ncbi:MAG: hypothetical protein ACC652_11290, partial [Acidimicrobiales bacterium]